MNVIKEKERLEMLLNVLKTPNIDDLLKAEINNEIRKIILTKSKGE